MAAHQKAVKAGLKARPPRSFGPGRASLTVVATVLLCTAGLQAWRGAGAPPRRIISLVPSVTEIIYALGAGSRVVAVSSYDTYPPEVKTLPNVGALIDPNVERILSLTPDLVVVYGSQDDLMEIYGLQPPQIAQAVRDGLCLRAA